LGKKPEKESALLRKQSMSHRMPSRIALQGPYQFSVDFYVSVEGRGFPRESMDSITVAEISPTKKANPMQKIQDDEAACIGNNNDPVNGGHQEALY
jgi:hypothetical protein